MSPGAWGGALGPGPIVGSGGRVAPGSALAAGPDVGAAPKSPVRSAATPAPKARTTTSASPRAKEPRPGARGPPAAPGYDPDKGAELVGSPDIAGLQAVGIGRHSAAGAAEGSRGLLGPAAHLGPAPGEEGSLGPARCQMERPAGAPGGWASP